MKRRIYLFVTGTVIVTALVVWLGRRHLRDERAALAAALSQRSEAASGLSAARGKLAAASRAQVALEGALAEARALNQTEPADKKTGAAETAENKSQPPDPMALMEANPELRAINTALKRAEARMRYLPLYHALKLPPEKIASFQKLLVDAEEEKIDLHASAKMQGLAEDDLSVVQLKAEAKARLESSEREILGEAGMRELDRFTRAEPLGSVVGRVSSLVGNTATPVSLQQAEQFFDLLKSANAPFNAGAPADLMVTDWPKVLAEAQRVLAPAQYNALKAESNFWYVARLAVKFYEQENAR